MTGTGISLAVFYFLRQNTKYNTKPWASEQGEQRAAPNFWHGKAGHSSCSPKSLSLLHCDVRLSRIELDILKFCRSVGRSRTKKPSASGGLRPPDTTRGSAPGPRWGLPQTPVIGSRSARSPCPPLPNPKYATVCWRHCFFSPISI